MIARAPAIGWGVLLGAAAVASFSSLSVQLGFASVAVGVIGMAHGASDLAIVEPHRRPWFLILYGVVSLACLLWWVAYPAVALPLFLLASAIHFGVEDAPADRPLERLVRGIGLVAAPAAFHAAELGQLLQIAGGSASTVTAMMGLYASTGLVTGGLLLLIAIRRRDPRLFTGATALLILPPLVGFSVGFLILHALPQTIERQRQLGISATVNYLKAVAPILAAAIVIVGAVGTVLLNVDGTGIRSLFVGVAALAIPHLLVTPWFEPVSIAPHGKRITGGRTAPADQIYSLAASVPLRGFRAGADPSTFGPALRPRPIL